MPDLLPLTPDTYDQLGARYTPYFVPWGELDPGAEILDLSPAHAQWHKELTHLGLRPRTGTLAGATAAHYAGVTGLGLADDADTLDMVAPATAALRPGGILLISGPNPERGGTRARALWAEDLAEAFAAAGLIRVRVLRLNGALRPEAPVPNLRAVFEGISPDIAVIGQRPLGGAAGQAFYPAFAAERGADIETMLVRYDTQIEGRPNRVHAAEIQALQSTLTATRIELDHTRVAFQHQLTALEERLARATRRRGLRRLAEILRERRRARRNPPAPEVRPSDPQDTVPAWSPDPHARDLTPLSSRESAIAARLRGES